MKKPNFVPLVLIVVLTSLLAIPSAIGTFVLFDKNSGGASFDNATTNQLIVVSLAGFALLFGYYATALTKKFSAVFWICSFLYNLVLGVVYVYFLAMSVSDVLKYSNFPEILFPFLFTSWIWFVAAASLYYARCARQSKTQKMP